MCEPRRTGPGTLLRSLALGLVLLAGAGCAASRLPTRPVRLTASEVEAFAGILRLEDRREFDRGALERLSTSPSPHVRRRTALALGRFRNADALPLLRGLLADGDTAVAATAAFSLGQVGDTTAVPWLAASLAGSPSRAAPTVASEAAYALGKLRSRAAAEALTALLAGTSEREAVSPVIGSALLAAWRFPRPEDLEPIARWSRADDPEIRWRAAYALTRRADPRATPLLQGLAGDSDPRVRALALRGLTAPLADSSGVGAAAVLPGVLGALRDADYAVRINAARVLGSHRSPAAVAELMRLASDAEPHLRVVALESLGRLGRSAVAASAVVRAVAMADDAPLFVRQTAAETLALVSPEEALSVADLLRNDPRWRLRAAAARALAKASGATDRRLMEFLRDSDARVAALALQAAVDAAGPTLEPLRSLLLQQLGARDVVVRATAIGALGRLGDRSTLTALLDAYDRAQADTLNDAALAAVDAVAALRTDGSDPASIFFMRFRRSPDYLVRLRARERFGDAALRSWGAEMPIETGLEADRYRSLVTRMVVPAWAGAAAPEVAIETGKGEIRLRLSAGEAPLTVESFLQLAARGYFDGQEWPRVVPNFVVQGGDPRGDTNGGPGYTLRDEIHRARYEAGTLGMALSGPDTGGSQFFVTHSPQPHLDGIYTVFGEVVAGGEVAERLLPGDTIVRIRRVR